MKSSLLYFFSFFLMWFANAQGNIEDVQIIIEKDKPLVLPEANRIYQKAQLTNVLVDTSKLKFSYVEPSVELQSFQPSLKLAMAESVMDVSDYPGFIKIGAGNYLGSRIIAGYTMLNNSNPTSLWLSHEGFGKGPVSGKSSALSNSKFLASSTFQGATVAVLPSLSYLRDGYHYYGFDQQASIGYLSPDGRYTNEKGVFQDVGLKIELKNGQSSPLHFSSVPSFSYSILNIEGVKAAIENRLKIDNRLTFGKSPIGVDFGFSGAYYDSYSLKQQRSKVELRPVYSLYKDDFSAILGINFTYSQKTWVFPDLKVKYLFSDNFFTFINVSGNVDLNALDQVQQLNRFLDDSLTLKSTVTKISTLIGFNYQLAPGFFISPEIGGKLISNQGLYVLSSIDTSRFVLTYEPKMTQFIGGISLQYQADKFTDLSLTYHHFSFQTAINQQAWSLPTNKLNLRAARSFDQWQLVIGFNMLSGIKSYTATSFETTTLEPIFDLNMSVNYQLNERITFWGEGYNLLSQSQQRFINYPSIGLQAKFGFIFQF